MKDYYIYVLLDPLTAAVRYVEPPELVEKRSSKLRGIKRSAEFIEHLRMPKSLETKARMAAANRLRTHTDASKAKISAARKGKPALPHVAEMLRRMAREHLNNPDSIAKAAAKNTGRRNTEETRQRMREANLAWRAKKKAAGGGL